MSSRKRHDSSSSDSSSSSASGKDSDGESDSSQSSSGSSDGEKTRNMWRTAERKAISPIHMNKDVESGELSSSDGESPGKVLKSSVQRLPASRDRDFKKSASDKSDGRRSGGAKGRQPELDKKVTNEEQGEETVLPVSSKSEESPSEPANDRHKDRKDRSRSPLESASREKDKHLHGDRPDLDADRAIETRPGRSPRQKNSPRDRSENSRSRGERRSPVDVIEDETNLDEERHRSDQRGDKDYHSPDRHDNTDRHRSDRRFDKDQHRSDRSDEKDRYHSERHSDRDQGRRDRHRDRQQRDDQDKENRNRNSSQREKKSERKADESDRKRPAEDSSRQDGAKDIQGEVTRPSKKKSKEGDTIMTRTGGAYIPPARLRMMQAEITDKTSVAYQRIAWEALKKSINGRINKVNTSNLIEIVKELFQENIVRGRGLLARSIIQAQAASPTFTSVYAALVAIINTKFPQNGELILRRLIIQFRKGFRRNDKNLCLSSTRFLAHLVNQQVAHEVLALEVLTLLMETPTDDSVEVAVGFLKECGQKLTEVSPRGINAIFDRLRNILHEGQIDTRVQYMVEVMFAVRKDGFKDHPSLVADLDLVEEDDQFTHLITLDDAGQSEDILNVFKADPDFQVNEDKYKTLKKEILDEDSSGSESGSGSDGEDSSEEENEEDEEEKQKIIDQTETNLVALRRTIYLTVQSSLDFEECAHKIIRLELKAGQEVEVCNMILDCCAQLRTYEKFYGLLAQRFCQIDRKYIEPFQNIFKEQYETVHRLETNKLRIVAKFFAHLLHTDAIAWGVLSCIRLNEDDTTSASRIFVKILFQELSEYMGLTKLNNRIKDPTLQTWFEGIMPRDNPKNTRFAINFFTTIGLGGLTDDLRDHLRNMSKQLLQQKQQAEPESDSSDSSDSGSNSDSSSDSSHSSSSSDSSSDSDSEPKTKSKKKVKESPKKRDKKKSVANGIVRDSDIFPTRNEPSYSDPWDRQYKGSNKVSNEEKRSKSDKNNSKPDDRKSRSDKKNSGTDDRKSGKSSRSEHQRTRSNEREPMTSDKQSRSDSKRSRIDERNSTTDLLSSGSRSNHDRSRTNERSSRQEEKGFRSEEKLSRANQNDSRSDDRRSRPEDDRSRQVYEKQRPDKRRPRSDDEFSQNDIRDNRSRRTEEISRAQERNLHYERAQSNSDERNSRSNGKSSKADGRSRRQEENVSSRNDKNSKSDGKIARSSEKMSSDRRSRSSENDHSVRLTARDRDVQMSRNFQPETSSDSDSERMRQDDRVKKQRVDKNNKNRPVYVGKKSRSRRSESEEYERDSPERVKKRKISDEEYNYESKYSKNDRHRDEDYAVESDRQERNGSGKDRDRRDYNDDRSRNVDKSRDRDSARSDRKSSRTEEPRQSSRRR